MASFPGMGLEPRYLLVALLCSFVLARTAAADITVKATVDSRQARVGESIGLSILIEGAQNVSAPQVRINGLEVHYIGPSTQVSIVNGRVASSIQHRYSVVSAQPGRFELGPFSVSYDGKDYTTSPIGIEFVAASASGPGNPNSAQGKTLYATLTTPKPEVYLHESIPIEVNLYVGPVRVGDLQFPNLTPDGLFIDPFPQPTQAQQVIDGQNYQVVTFHTNAVPLRAGTLSIAPASVRLTVYERGRRGGADPFFDNFFQQGRQVDIRTEPLTLHILPLPEAGKPADFSGAVGNFTLRVQASPTELTAGDPITVKLELTGAGNLNEATPPAPIDATGFRLYDPRVISSDSSGRIFEQVLIPSDPGLTAVPPFRFSFFDPKTASYRRLQSQPISLRVQAPQQTPRTSIVTSDSSIPRNTDDETLGRDIVFLKDEPGNLVPASPNAELWLALSWLPIPPLLFAVAAWYDTRRRRLRGDERYARFTRAGKEARHGLSRARDLMARNQGGEFYEAVATTLREYLSAKLDIPIGGVDADAVAKRGVAADCVDDLRSFFDACEQARFARRTGESDLRGILDLAERIVNRIERQRRGTSLGSLLWYVAILLSSGYAWAAETTGVASPQTTFFHANGLYREGRYSEALREYESLVKGGAASAPLYFNLGNAAFKAGDRGRAILHYERAWRLAPNDPDIAANLAYARSLNGVDPCAPSLWLRAIFPLVEQASLRVLVQGTLFLYSLFFLLLVAQRILRPAPRWLPFLLAATGLLTLWVALSTGRTLQIQRLQTHGVILAAGETPARFEPAENGTVHFSMKQGSTVQILEEREAWIQIARCDGRRGWVPRATTEPF